MTVEQAKEKVVSVARSEVGYREGANNYNKFADDPGIERLYGWKPQNKPWCCVFVNWCFLNSFGYDIGSRLTYGGTAACSASAQLFKNNDAFVKSPRVGDQAFYYSNGGINHTGIVVEVNGTKFTAIEGNYSDKVSTVTRNMYGPDIAGFGRPNWYIATTGNIPGENAENSQKPASNSQNTALTHVWKPKTLQYGQSYSRDCIALQALLTVKEFPCGVIDGEFGAKTQAAVMNAQKFYNLKQDGICGPKTWAKLLEVK